MAYIFNGTAKTITLSLGTVIVDLVDLYSRWKDWAYTNNAGYTQAFKAVGGDIPAIPLYLFILNGWKIIPQSANHTLSIVNGVLEVEGGGDPFIDPVGTFKIRITRESPGIAIGYSTTGGSSAPSVDTIVSAIVVALTATTIPVDMQKTNGVEIIGDGTDGNKFRSVYVG